MALRGLYKKTLDNKWNGTPLPTWWFIHKDYHYYYCYEY